MEREVVVEAFARVHIGLSDLGRTTRRAFGGCGFAISHPVVRLAARPARAMDLHGMEHLDEPGRADVLRVMDNLAAYSGREIGASISLGAPIRQHVGLGSKTATLLAVLQSVNELLELGLEPRELQLVSGRGGTSGVGIHTYFEGGYAADAGHAQETVDQLHPSSRQSPESIPALLTRASFPGHWTVWLLMPPGQRIAGEHEVAFFEKATPIPGDEVLKTLALIHHGVTPAVLSDDIRLLAEVLPEIHRIGFKRHEYDAQPRLSRDVLTACWEEGLAAGLSSMGPLLYLIVDNAEIPRPIAAKIRGSGVELIGPLEGRNRGAALSVV